MSDDPHSAPTEPGSDHETERLKRKSGAARGPSDETMRMGGDDPHTAPTLPGSAGRTGRALTREEIASAREAMLADTASVTRPQFDEPRRGLPVALLIGAGLLLVAVCIALGVAVFVFGVELPGTGGSKSDTIDDESEGEGEGQVTPDAPDDEPTSAVTADQPTVTITPTAGPLVCECRGTALWCDNRIVGDDVAECQPKCECLNGDLYCNFQLVEEGSEQCVAGPSPVCECQGPALVCGGEIVVEDSLECTLDWLNCSCQGTSWVCDGVTIETDALNCPLEDEPTDQPTGDATDATGEPTQGVTEEPTTTPDCECVAGLLWCDGIPTEYTCDPGAGDGDSDEGDGSQP